MARDVLADAILLLPNRRYGELLEQRRRECGFTLRRAAECIAVEEQQLADAEHGMERMPMAVLARLLKAYGLEPEQFVPPRVAIDPALLQDGSAETVLRRYVEVVRERRKAAPGEPLRFRADDIRVLVKILGTEPHGIERRLRSYTGCTSYDARRLSKIIRRSIPALPAAALPRALHRTVRH